MGQPMAVFLSILADRHVLGECLCFCSRFPTQCAGGTFQMHCGVGRLN